jgi:hypothetical protein
MESLLRTGNPQPMSPVTTNCGSLGGRELPVRCRASTIFSHALPRRNQAESGGLARYATADTPRSLHSDSHVTPPGRSRFAANRSADEHHHAPRAETACDSLEWHVGGILRAVWLEGAARVGRDGLPHLR